MKALSISWRTLRDSNGSCYVQEIVNDEQRATVGPMSQWFSWLYIRERKKLTSAVLDRIIGRLNSENAPQENQQVPAASVRRT